jgi:hypothetical protein
VSGVSLSSLAVADNSTATFTFTLQNSFPSGGYVAVTFPPAFGRVKPTSGSINKRVATYNISASGKTAWIGFASNATSYAAGTVMTVTLSPVELASAAGPVVFPLIRTMTSSMATIDQATYFAIHSLLPPGLTFSSSLLHVVEGLTTDSYTITLNTAPDSDVIIGVRAPARLTASPASITLNSSNWATGRTITVSAVDDSSPYATGTLSLGHVITTADTIYSKPSKLSFYPSRNVSVVTYDNDFNGVAISPTVV